MEIEEAIDFLNIFTPQEAIVFFYCKVCKKSVHAAAKARCQRKASYVYLLGEVERKLANVDKHEQAIAGIQELIRITLPVSFFIRKK